MLKKVSPEAAFNAYKKGMNVVIRAQDKWVAMQNAVFAVDFGARKKVNTRTVTPADKERMESLFNKGFSYSRIAEETGFSKQTVFNHLNKKEGKTNDDT